MFESVAKSSTLAGLEKWALITIVHDTAAFQTHWKSWSFAGLEMDGDGNCGGHANLF